MELERARQGELQRDKKSVNSAGITWSCFCETSL